MNVYAFITPLVDRVTAVGDRLQHGRTQRRLQLPGHNHQPRHRASVTSASIWPWPSSCIPGTAGCYQFAPWQIPTTWYSMLGLLVISDFVFYWFHRTGPSGEHLLGRTHAAPQQRGDEPLRGPARQLHPRASSSSSSSIGSSCSSASRPSRSTPSPRSTCCSPTGTTRGSSSRHGLGRAHLRDPRHTTGSTMA
jgi:hypothetical protein